MIKRSLTKSLKKSFGILTIISACLLLTACAQDPYLIDSTHYSEEYDAKNLTQDKNAMMIAGADINAAISDLEKVERYRKPRILKVTDENMAEIGLGTQVFIDWSGPIEPLIAEVAAYSDYKLKVLGIAPAIPVLVTVVQKNIELGDIVKEAHLQAKARADVVIYPKSKVIEIRYFELG